MDAKTSIRVIIIRMLILFLFLSSSYTMVVAKPNDVVPRASKSLVFHGCMHRRGGGELPTLTF